MSKTTLTVGFGRHRIELRCDCSSLAVEMTARVGHMLRGRAGQPLLVVDIVELAEGCAQAHASSGHTVAGSINYVCYRIGRLMAAAFMAAEPDLLWLHASAVARDGRALVLVGPSGAGKSTVAVHLIDRGWHLLADDLVAVQTASWRAVPLPFTPEYRCPHSSWPSSPKTVRPVPPSEVAQEPTPIGMLVVPQFQACPTHSSPEVLSALATIVAIAPHCQRQTRRLAIQAIAGLSESVPCLAAPYSSAQSIASCLDGLDLDRRARHPAALRALAHDHGRLRRRRPNPKSAWSSDGV